MTDDLRNVVWQAELSPYGTALPTVSLNDPGLCFPGQWDEAETALLQNWHRDYDPTLGRYIEADPLGLFQDDRGKKPPKRGKTKKLPKGGPLTALQLGRDFVNGTNRFQDSVPGMFEPPANVPGMCTPDDRDNTNLGNGDDEPDRCRLIEENVCRPACNNIVLESSLITDFGHFYRRCVNQCLYDNNCPGNNYPEGWDNRRGSIRPWKKW